MIWRIAENIKIKSERTRSRNIRNLNLIKSNWKWNWGITKKLVGWKQININFIVERRNQKI